VQVSANTNPTANPDFQSLTHKVNMTSVYAVPSFS